MCGIAGIIHFPLHAKQVQKDQLECLQSFLTERGPDSQGLWQNDSVGLVHTRLSILDLSELGHQPMTNADKSIFLTYNGEIYNFPELRKILQKEGVHFKSETDTEVLIHGYITWGIERLLEQIEGMFAFALYDTLKRKIFLVRDRWGQKPLYYFHTETECIFSSDIRGIHALKKDELTLSFESLDYYLSELSSPQPNTIWKEISQIPPAHFGEISLEHPHLNISRYWHLDHETNQNLTEEEALEITESQLTEAIMKRTLSDVPLGCFLSGGIDSGLIVSMLATHSNYPIKTFTVGFDHDEYNELEDARLVAERYQTDHHEIRLKPNVLETLPELVDYYGEPFADSSMIPTYYISKAIRSHVTVALAGDGGDEMFGGYIDYGYAWLAQQFEQAYPNPWLQKAVSIGSKVGSRFLPSIPNFGTEQEYLQQTDSRKLHRNMGFNPGQKKRLVREELFPLLGYTEAYLGKTWSENAHPELTQNLMLASLHTRLPNDYLVKVDRASMKNSLEVRSPFLDHKLAEAAFQIPLELKFKHNQPKYLLKRLGENYMYQDIFTRKKRGFGIPIKYWLANELSELVQDTLSPNAQINQYVHFSEIQRLLREHNSEKRDHTHRIWSLLCLEIWLQKFT